MRHILHGLIAGSLLAFGATPAPAQGFAQLIEKLEKFESRLQKVESQNHKSVDAQIRNLATNQSKELQNLRAEISTQPQKEELQHLSNKVNNLNRQVTEYAGQTDELRSLTSELRQIIQTMNQPTNPDVSEPESEQAQNTEPIHTTPHQKGKIKTELTYDLTLSSSFVGNGITWVDGVTAMPSLNLGIGSGNHRIDGTLWAAINGNEVVGYDNPSPAQYQVTEWDASLNYTYSGLRSADVSLGFVHYHFPKLNAHTQDIYAKLALHSLPLSPTVTWLYDTDGANKGNHVNLGISHTLLYNQYPIVLSANLVWADQNYGAAYFSGGSNNGQGIATWNVGITVPNLPLSNTLGITPKLTYSRLTNAQGVLGKTFQEWSSLGTSGGQDALSFSLSIGGKL